MQIAEFEIVVNDSYGAFGCSKDLAEWLIENREWKIVDHHEYFSTKDYKVHYPIETLIKYNTFYTFRSDDQIRINKDVIDGVKYLNNLYKDLSFKEKREKDFGLIVQKISIDVRVLDYNDGHEKVIVNASIL